MIERVVMVAMLRENLKRIHDRMKHQADKNMSERVFVVGDWVYLKIQPYKQVTMAVRSNIKLTSKYYGPFQGIERIGAVAYIFNLPLGTTIHPVFHISQLKKRIGSHIIPQPKLPMVGIDGEILAQPIAVLDKRLIKKGNKVVVEIVVQWANLPK